MKNLKKGYTISVAVIISIVLASLLLTACGGRSKNSGTGGKQARSGFYIEEPSYGNASQDADTAIPNIYYFFDRTVSMQGFVAEKNTSYSAIIPQLWSVAESTKLWPKSAASASFFEFGNDVRKITRQFVRDNIQEKAFYGQGPRDAQIVQGIYNSREENSQVFETLSKYIATRPAENSLFITVTDLYEQNREDNCFSVFFSDAFSRGLSGALIAVESRFKGTVENISKDSTQNIKVDGKSTFFIFILGPRDILKKYCDALFVEFPKGEYNHVLFLINNDSRPANIPWTPGIRKASRPKMFEKIGYGSNINLKNDIPRLFTLNGTDPKQADPSKVAAFRLIGDIKSQYIGGISVDYADTDAFKYEAPYNVGFSRGDRVEQGAITVFEALNDNKKTNITIDVIDGNKVAGMDANRYPLAVAVGTKNASMDKGAYQIRYEIFQKAVIPSWVSKRSAATETELKESNRPDNPDNVIKILRLESIYRYIAEAYNYKPERGKIYADLLYLEKTR